MSLPDELTVYTDGAARGNPGPASIAFIIGKPGQAPLYETSESIGTATNNVAEYTALVRALDQAARLGARRLKVLSDSELMVKQMNGEYRVKNDQIRDLYDQAQTLKRRFDSVVISHIPRSLNSHADRLCNETLDSASKKKPTGPALRTFSQRKSSSGANGDREDYVREEAVTSLRAAAAAWSAGNPNVPSAEQVWDQLWSILEEGGVVRPRRARN